MKFESMFRAIHGHDPFPWQCEAARRLVEKQPFAAVNVPTAAGKTALIDAAVYSAAHGGPRRIAFVIDRRVVVDEAYDRAKRIAEGLKQPSMSELANRLGPVRVVRLRGGVHGDDDWVLYPDKVTVIVSTVDQVGSRLLHRGYGVSPRMAPVHAGFVGNEAIYFVDEAHISVPFVETVESACRYGADVRLVAMTATPVAEAAKVVNLTAEDRSHPVLKRRLQAKKWTKLEHCPDKEQEFVKKAVSAAQCLAESATVIGIVVNRVNTARSIHKSLLKAKHRAELLTGRIRPYDRDRLMERLLPEIRAGRVRKKAQPVFVVATQTIEVGADLDFDALVTEAATLDALRQRFGRLDRLGEQGNTQGVILYRPKVDESGKKVPDPIYGSGIHDTWNWLNEVAEQGCVDFGTTAMEEYMKQVEPPKAEPKHAPTLLPVHVTLLGQTGPEAPHVDISPWLHGPQGGSADVSLVWRADLDPHRSELWEETVQLRPPLTREALEIPIYAARAWVENRGVQEITDLEGIESSSGQARGSGKPVLCWRGSDDCDVVTDPRKIHPGDTLVIPAEYGGRDQYGWAPRSKAIVEDIADLCSLDRGSNHVVRLVRGLTAWTGAAEEIIQEAVAEVVSSETEFDTEMGIDHDRVEAAYTALRDLLTKLKHPLVKSFRRRFEIERHPLGVVLRGRIIDEVDATLSGGVQVELYRHLEGVAEIAEKLAISHPGREYVVRAARKHDQGKSEPRFQTLLHGNPLAAAVGPLLAKSGLRKLSQKLAALAESGLPKGFRHELASLALPQGRGTSDADMLVRHLIATHHGYGRPWFPACADQEALGVSHVWLGSGWAQAFAVLSSRHGPWQLAGMELLLRAADARQSKAEQENSNA